MYISPTSVSLALKPISVGVQETLESLKVTLSNEDVQELQEFANKADIEDLWYSGKLKCIEHLWVHMDVQDQVD
ncbi:hypothetical protein PSHT_15716 [Puccinia striiformis]|uniref:Uncharacterized protein n=1 Tax=Puccinia striiformis TaxID=27350 RepID=A0A2S4UDN7_9BASI|nr:hypothetical protein PSHT_15716 [Puccinia striiformis]